MRHTFKRNTAPVPSAEKEMDRRTADSILRSEPTVTLSNETSHQISGNLRSYIYSGARVARSRSHRLIRLSVITAISLLLVGPMWYVDWSYRAAKVTAAHKIYRQILSFNPLLPPTQQVGPPTDIQISSGDTKSYLIAMYPTFTLSENLYSVPTLSAKPPVGSVLVNVDRTRGLVDRSLNNHWTKLTFVKNHVQYSIVSSKLTLSDMEKLGGEIDTPPTTSPNNISRFYIGLSNVMHKFHNFVLPDRLPFNLTAYQAKATQMVQKGSGRLISISVFYGRRNMPGHLIVEINQETGNTVPSLNSRRPTVRRWVAPDMQGRSVYAFHNGIMNHETTLIWYDPTRMVTFRVSFYGDMTIHARAVFDKLDLSHLRGM